MARLMMVKRIINIGINFLEKKLNSKELKSRPWKYFIEVSLSCNLNCITCGHHRSRFSGIMSDVVFEHIKPILNFAKVVHEVGYGEPFLAPNFFDILKYIKQLGIYVDIYTNGMLLSQRFSEQLVTLGLDQITFSIDGNSKETFESIRIGGDYSKIISNIGKLHQVKVNRRSLKPFLRANFVGMRRNIEELPQLIENADQWGIKEVVLSDMFPPSEELAQESLFYCRDLADSVIERCKSIAKEHRINFISPSVFHDPEFATKGNMVLNVAKSKPEGTEEDHPPHPRRDDAPQNKRAKEAPLKNPYPCYEPWQTLYITHDGNVRPCCVINEAFGSLLNETISEIWNNEKYRLLRESVNTLSPVFEGCKGCLLRRRVHFSAREGLFIWLRYVQNNGLFHTMKKTLRYMMEYF